MTAPVGLEGLQSTIMRVSSVTAAASASMSGSQALVAGHGYGTSVAPRMVADSP